MPSPTSRRAPGKRSMSGLMARPCRFPQMSDTTAMTASAEGNGGKSPEKAVRMPSLSPGLTDLTPDARKQLNLQDDERGALVERVNPRRPRQPASSLATS